MTNREYAESKNIHGLMDSGADIDAPLEQAFKDFIDAISECNSTFRRRQMTDKTIQEIKWMIEDINFNEIKDHNSDILLQSWIRSWRGRMKELIEQLEQEVGA